ncbi:gliding motility lipoprotein GldH [uncultured Bacteroides sp.]|uniref:gliding motility lipoprotein GldH n=1 Tax=uncultured Bacteroides sp. TaxID=162156 RepID=UPI002AA654F7|nr:gliding motility lipoprotein GldH [uncultured Bacteroides sp.]
MKRPINSNICLILLLLLFFITACDNKTVYHSFQHIPDIGWKKNDTLTYTFELKDSMVYLHLFAEVRNRNDYPYQNLYIAISQNLKDSMTWKSDTLNLSLADKKGKWVGNGWGNLFQISVPISNVLATHPGKYTLKISQEMKDNPLKGINDVGIRIEK